MTIQYTRTVTGDIQKYFTNIPVLKWSSYKKMYWNIFQPSNHIYKFVLKYFKTVPTNEPDCSVDLSSIGYSTNDVQKYFTTTHYNEPVIKWHTEYFTSTHCNESVIKIHHYPLHWTNCKYLLEYFTTANVWKMYWNISALLTLSQSKLMCWNISRTSTVPT